MAKHRRKEQSIVGLLVTIIAALLITYGNQQGWLKAPPKQTTAPGVTTVQAGQYTVTRYVDGDTITIDLNGTKETIRIIGIDTPETHKPNAPVQCYGPAAAAYTKNRIASQGGTVQLSTDTMTDDRDRYNRLLRYISLADGTDLGRELISKGYAFAYLSFPFTRSDDYATAQKTAQDTALGLWSSCTPTQDASGRWQSNNE